MVNIRLAKPDEQDILTEISFASKRYWDYPEEYFEIWKDELTITSGYIDKNIVYAVQWDEQIIAYFSIVFVPEDMQTKHVLVQKGWWLEHMFVLPEYIGKGIGRQMVRHMLKICGQKHIGKLNVFADPFAKGFYEKTGFNYVGEYPSGIAERTVCLFEAGQLNRNTK